MQLTLQTILEHYPGAVSVSQLQLDIMAKLHANSWNADSAIWATSFCSDELSNNFRIFNSAFAAPAPFILGGIAGFPFAGVTGMNAFLSHVPTEGVAVILYGPHIGISKEGKVGQLNRRNQKSNTSCCGSLCAAISTLKASTHHNQFDDPLEYQQERVLHHLAPHAEEILAAEYKVKVATQVAYDSIHEKMSRILSSEKVKKEEHRICLVGGILINTDWEEEDFFQVRHSELII